LPPADTTNTEHHHLVAAPPRQNHHHRSHRAPPPWLLPSHQQPTPTATTTTATATAFTAATAVVAGCGWQFGNHRRGAVRRQTTIVVAVGRRYSHHSRTLWCRAVMAQPLVKPRGVQPLKTTTVVAAEPTTATTAAPWWCRARGGDPPFC
nr:hypothetical protein [Tanacetum cinerariifolium]